MKKLLLLLLIPFLFCSPLRKYERIENFQHWENDIVKFEQMDYTKQYPLDAVMFCGSSSIRLWGTLEEDMKPYNVIQRGYGGAKLTDYAYYLERIVYPHQFQAIVFFIANDIHGGEADKTPEEVGKLFELVLSKVRKKYQSVPLFWIEITPTNSRWKVWDNTAQANQKIKEICENSENTYFIQTSDQFIGEDGLPKKELFREDQLHLNADGYAIWTKIVKNKLDEVLK